MDGQNFQNNYQQPTPPEGPQKTDTLAIVSLILGIASIVLGCCVTYLGIALGVGGIICSVMSKKKQKSGLATAGLVSFSALPSWACWLPPVLTLLPTCNP